MNKLALGILTAVVLTAGAAPVGATASSTTTRPVYRVTDPTFASDVYWAPLPIVGASSVLTRQATGDSIRFSTHGLPRGHAVTLWWFVFNHPENCTHGTALGHCGPHDLALFQGDPSVETSLVYGTGQVVGTLGYATFSSSIVANDASRAVSGYGVTNPRGAEIHVGLRDDGPSTVPVHFRTDLCFECPFVQFSAFRA